MTTRIEKQAATFRGVVRGLGRDWLAGAVLLMVWTALWTVFTAGVLAPGARLAHPERARAASVAAAHPEPRSLESAWVAAR